MDAEAEIDMEISDDEQESLKRCAGQVVNGREVNQQHPAGPSKNDFNRKRKRLSSVETSPSVRVEYRHLSRESRRKLQDLLRDWSLWQGYHSRHSSSESIENLVENGEEEYYPALQVGPTGNSFSVTFWVDKPAKQARRKEAGDSGGVKTNSQDVREGEADVPLYDRVTPSLSTQESRKDGCVELEREAVRCFNCGSYSHALRDCQRPWNYEAINSARSSHASKKTLSSGPRSVARYYETQSSNENVEPDRASGQFHQNGGYGHPSSYVDNEASRNLSASEEEGKSNKLSSTVKNEEGGIVDGVASPREEDLYIAISPDTPSQVTKTTADFSGTRVLYNSVPEQIWRSPPPGFSPPGQMHPHFHHQRSFAYPPQNPVYSHNPSPVHYGGMNTSRSWDERHPQRSWDERHLQRSWEERQPQRSWEERQPQRSWEGRNLYHSENISSPAVNGTSAPIAIPATKKEDDDWELNFESSEHQTESSRSFVGVPGVTDHYTPSARHQTLTLNTIAGFSPPDPSQLSPTGSGYGDSFRPSTVPQTPVQNPLSYLSPQERKPTYPSEAWGTA